MTTADKWQKMIDHIWQEKFAEEMISRLYERRYRIMCLKKMGVKPKRINGKTVVPK